MFERLIAFRFQKHKKRVIDFDRITTIVGSSDVGKSALIRLLRWIATNRPSGDEFIRWGSKSVLGRLKVDGHTISRGKGKSNFYKLDKRKPFKAFGTTVPPDIQDILRMEDVNFQAQLDSPFWFTETPGQVSRELNQVVDLGLIDSSLANIGAIVRKSSSEVSALEDLHSEAVDQYNKLEWVDDAMEEWKKIETIESQIDEHDREIGKLRRLMSQLQEVEDSIIPNAEKVLDELLELIELGEEILKQGEELKELEESVNTWRDLDTKLDSLGYERDEIEHKLSQVKECPTCGRPLLKG